MGLFGFGKKKESQPSCCCSSDKETAPVQCCCNASDARNIKVLGGGCKSCHELYEHAQEAADKLSLGIAVEYITDMEKVMSYGVMTMPVLVINDQIAGAGKVFKSSEVEEMLHKFGY